MGSPPQVDQNRTAIPKAPSLRKGLTDKMTTLIQRQSTPGLNPQPQPAASLPLAVMMALSFTIILIQLQSAMQGGAGDLLPILAAAFLAVAGNPVLVKSPT
jgi:hypothetical protein